MISSLELNKLSVFEKSFKMYSHGYRKCKWMRSWSYMLHSRSYGKALMHWRSKTKHKSPVKFPLVHFFSPSSPHTFPPHLALCLHLWVYFCLHRCTLQLITVNSHQICLSLFTYIHTYIHTYVCMYIYIYVSVCMCDLGWNSKPASTPAVHHRPTECRSLSLCYSLLCSLLHFTPLTSNSHFPNKSLPP